MIRSFLRALPIVALAMVLVALPAAATGDHHDDSREKRSHEHRAGNDDSRRGHHPSGKDRNEEPGKSGTQGKSTSDPDGDSNGGADKPGGDGGYDDDKDGNNGCGNDRDFEDDNRGNCGGKADARDGSEKREKHEKRAKRQEREKREKHEKRAKRQEHDEHEKRGKWHEKDRDERTEAQDRAQKRDRRTSKNREANDRRSSRATLHCPDHRRNMKWEGSSGSQTIDGVTLDWDGESLTITNGNDAEALVQWCAKGGRDFAEDGKTTGVREAALPAGASVTETFGTDVSYVVVYDVEVDSDEGVAGDEQEAEDGENETDEDGEKETDEDVAGDEEEDEDGEKDESSSNVDVTKIITIVKNLDVDVEIRRILELEVVQRYLTVVDSVTVDETTRALLSEFTAVLELLLELLAEGELTVDTDVTDTTGDTGGTDTDGTDTDGTDTDGTEAGGTDTDGTDDASTDEGEDVLSGELVAAPDAEGDDAAAAPDADDAAGAPTGTEVAGAAQESGEDTGGDALALTGGAIALLAMLALLTLGGGSLLVRRNEG